MLLVKMKDLQECSGMSPEMDKLIPGDRHIILRVSDHRLGLYWTPGTDIFTHIDMEWVDEVVFDGRGE